jgi:hypothetical protein
MKVPPIGCPRPAAPANLLRLKNVTGVVGVTQVWLLNVSDCSKRRKIYLLRQTRNQNWRLPTKQVIYTDVGPTQHAV